MDASPPSVAPKEEPDVFEVDDDGKRAALLRMDFSVKEVDSAMAKLGMDAPIDEIVDFITAVQIAAKFDNETNKNHDGENKKSEGVSDETLFGTMEKTLGLLELGFSEKEISSAFEKLGSDTPILELANAICAEQVGEKYIIQDKRSFRRCGMHPSYAASHSGSSSMHMEHPGVFSYIGKLKTEDSVQDTFAPSRNLNSLNLEELHRGKKPKPEYAEDYPDIKFRHVSFEDIFRSKRLKPQHPDEKSLRYGATWNEQKVAEDAGLRIPRAPKPDSCDNIDRMVAKRPYFFYGNVGNVPFSTWGKISQFLDSTEPEFVNTGWFSALSRKEGYVHNLPTEDRFRILPKPPMSIEEAMPHVKKWWPSWDTRKQLSCISSETSGVSEMCGVIGRILRESGGMLSLEEKREMVHQFEKWNLVWVDWNKVEPVGAEYLEVILGYPLNHTEELGSRSKERLETLANSFQVDTLGYHISGLKRMFPEGIRMMSVGSGIGGAEVSMHRLGIHMKAVVSVESSERKRRILRRWWGRSGQRGELEEMESIEKLTTRRIEGVMERYGGVDVVVCQSGSREGEEFEMGKFHEFVRVVQRVRRAMGLTKTGSEG